MPLYGNALNRIRSGVLAPLGVGSEGGARKSLDGDIRFDVLLSDRTVVERSTLVVSALGGGGKPASMSSFSDGDM